MTRAYLMRAYFKNLISINLRIRKYAYVCVCVCVLAKSALRRRLIVLGVHLRGAFALRRSSSLFKWCLKSRTSPYDEFSDVKFCFLLIPTMFVNCLHTVCTLFALR